MPQTADSPPQLRRDDALDGLRGIAVALVFFFHYGGGLRAASPAVRALGFLSQAGWMGLDLFFALSGFLITSILLRSLAPLHNPPQNLPKQQPHVLRNFYARRALRILPLYWGALLAAALAALLLGSSLGRLRPLLLYAAFLQNVPLWPAAALQTPPPLPLYHLWTVAVEEQFYLLWPALLLLARRPRRVLWLCVLVFVLSCLFRLTVVLGPWLRPTDPGQLMATLPAQAGALAAGSALAVLVLRVSLGLLKRAAWATLLGTSTVLAAGALHSHSFLFEDALGRLVLLPAVHLLAAAVVGLALCPGTLRSLLGWPPLVSLGRISYGFYVLHILLQPIFDRLATLTVHAAHGFAYQAARLLFALPITLAAAWFSFRVLEKPFRLEKNRFPLEEMHPFPTPPKTLP